MWYIGVVTHWSWPLILPSWDILVSHISIPNPVLFFWIDGNHPNSLVLSMESRNLPNYMGVSKDNGTPKSSILTGFSIINPPLWDTPIFGNIHISSSGGWNQHVDFHIIHKGWNHYWLWRLKPCLKRTHISPLNIGIPRRKGSSSNHWCSGVNSLLVSGRVTSSLNETRFKSPQKQRFCCRNMLLKVMDGYGRHVRESPPPKTAEHKVVQYLQIMYLNPLVRFRCWRIFSHLTRYWDCLKLVRKTVQSSQSSTDVSYCQMFKK